MDIVERLREKAERKSPNLYRKQQRIETEAADEIEQLRDALRWALPYVKNDERVKAIVRTALKEGK